ncbi:MAG: hypothetical protein WC279_01405 [Sulfurimonas sp.]|jgi:hypothetical protein|uniref:hypothetical protein n=1 Tax=unclassified Sulfurimonas TaxID=2623549 RepID=UPI0008C5FCA2|nr:MULTISPECIES: hypothetical protein [unclassified Sulfurimonas]MDO8259956.1 hypothetical protein [Candidatus Magasanikbacteria bacterium]OHE07927.1 MAG: hypothetical protein A3J96_07300 [Sulfurimonas sp. RIFOXYC2_FULL_36_7]OHE12652.1 MAG: hypothetical protein A2525_04545 [Sulfurimonas sp. RIFOXYD12_FULL_36_11]MBS4069538.1 hypothetical protein [Sulfurimonas sp.]MDD3854564.1 hypothetical protein [Sulfurimonas sp.]
MGLFLELEIVYIIIGIFILSVTAVVTTRDFMPKGAFKKGILAVGVVVSIMIGFHYTLTTKRMDGVEKIFNSGETVICENKMRRTVSRSVLLSQELGWKLEDHLFKHHDYERDFHTSRCVDWIGSEPQLEEDSKKEKQK